MNLINKYYLNIAKIESTILSMFIAYGTSNIVLLVLLVGIERLAIFNSINPINEFSVVAIVSSVFVIWIWSIFEAWERTNKFLSKLFKIDGEK